MLYTVFDEVNCINISLILNTLLAFYIKFDSPCYHFICILHLFLNFRNYYTIIRFVRGKNCIPFLYCVLFVFV